MSSRTGLELARDCFARGSRSSRRLLGRGSIGVSWYASDRSCRGFMLSEDPYKDLLRMSSVAVPMDEEEEEKKPPLERHVRRMNFLDQGTYTMQNFMPQKLVAHHATATRNRSGSGAERSALARVVPRGEESPRAGMVCLPALACGPIDSLADLVPDWTGSAGDEDLWHDANLALADSCRESGIPVRLFPVFWGGNAREISYTQFLLEVSDDMSRLLARF